MGYTLRDQKKDPLLMRTTEEIIEHLKMMEPVVKEQIEKLERQQRVSPEWDFVFTI